MEIYMELNEHWNKSRLSKLTSIPLFLKLHDELKTKDEENPSSAKGRLTILQKTLNHLDEKGNLIVQYKPSENVPQGRLYANHGLQSAPKWVRSFVGSADYYHDIDIVNAYPSILLFLCEKHHLKPSSYSMIKRYVHHR